jgi:hypothetical protein
MTLASSMQLKPRWLWIAPVVWLLDYIAARVLLNLISGPDWFRLLIALLPLPAFLFALWVFVRATRGLDELQRRIHAEALTIAFPIAVILLMMLGLLELVVPLRETRLLFREVWAALPLFYGLGLIISTRRYQ